MRQAVLILALVGCGRSGFDERVIGDGGGRIDSMPVLDGDGSIVVPPDASGCAAAVDHDDDGDGVRDGCDVCPDVSDSSQGDMDGDGVGDACDPFTAPKESLAGFDPFLDVRPAWSMNVAWLHTGDAVTTNAVGTTRNLRRNLDVTGRSIAFTGTIDTLGTGMHQIAIHFEQDPGPVYYCEIYGTTASASLNIRSAAAGTLASVPIGAFPTGPFRIAFRHRVAFDDVACELIRGGNVTQTSAMAPTFGTSNTVFLNVVDASVSVDMYSEIRTAP